MDLSHINFNQGGTMPDHVYKVIEVVGSSRNSMEEAVTNAVEKAGKTIHSMRWLEVVETRGHIENNQVAHWQVIVKIGFTID